MKKHTIMIPKPRSNFIKVECDICKNVRVMYTFSTQRILCTSCNAELIQSTGGQAKIFGKVLETLD
jgi:small subunit ribosomal protein S27e